MSKHHALHATHRNRSGSGHINSLRKEGFVPAIIYGRGVENENLKVIRKEVETILHGTRAEQILVNLTIGDSKEVRLALIQDVQHNALSGNITHIDFHQVKEDEMIHASIPLDLTGDAPGVKAGGMLEHLMHKLEVLCLPKDLPEFIQVDVSSLGLNQHLAVKDLVLPAGVKPKMDGAVIVAQVPEPRGGVAEPTPAEAAAADKKAAAGKGGKAAAKPAAKPAAKK